jgi:hypothetical protein
MRLVGSEKNIDTFIYLLNNLPMTSYIEKIDAKFDPIGGKNTATILLVIYQKNEAK